MACGVPCVTTDAGDARTILGNGGFVVGCGDFSGMATAMCNLLALSRAERQNMGLYARAQILERYSVQNVIDKYSQLISQRET